GYGDVGGVGAPAPASAGGGLGLAYLQIHPCLAQAFEVGLRVGTADDVQLQARPVVQRLGQGGDALVGVGGQYGAARLEVDIRQLFASAERRCKQRKRRTHRLDHQVDQHAHDDAAHGKLRVVQRPGNRQVDINIAAAVL